MRSLPRPAAERSADECGSAVVETVLVMVLLVGLTLALIQLALVGHVRSVLSAVAAEGARQAGRSGSAVNAGARYAEQAARDALGVDVACTAAAQADHTGLRTVLVSCTGTVTTTVLPVGHVTVTGSGRALQERGP